MCKPVVVVEILPNREKCCGLTKLIRISLRIEKEDPHLQVGNLLAPHPILPAGGGEKPI